MEGDGWWTYRLVGNEVVNVVAALPPADGKTTAKVGNEHANQSINLEDLCNGAMAGIVRGKHNLVLFMCKRKRG